MDKIIYKSLDELPMFLDAKIIGDIFGISIADHTEVSK